MSVCAAAFGMWRTQIWKLLENDDMALFSGLNTRQSSERTGMKAAMNIHCKNSLMEVIELQIIPRLVDSHPAFGPSKAQNFGTDFDPDAAEIAAFARICIETHPEVATQRIEQWVQRGCSMDDIFLKLITPVARHLGWMWEEDEADFSQVSIGLIRLQQITHQLGYSYQSGPQCAGRVRRLMIGSAPGSQHLLGLSIVSEFFRKGGWEVVVEIADTESALLEAVQSEWFDLVGLSVGLIEQLPSLADLIAQLKRASRNSKVPVILGGPAFLNSVMQGPELGADGISVNAADAVTLGSMLVELPAIEA
jgi:methanogenic corrinoid protein MtbC1